MFLYRLALAVGEWDVEQGVNSLAARITLDQVRRWMAFYRVEPFGDDWRRTGRSVGLIGATWTGKFDEHLEERFLPTYRANRPQTEQEMKAELMKVPAFRRQLEQQGQ